MSVLYLLIIIGTIALWFLLSGLFKPLGRFLSNIGEDAIENMKYKEEETKDE